MTLGSSYVGAHDPIGYLQLMIIRMGRYPNATDSGMHYPCYCDIQNSSLH